jgi:hypothetical protein
MAWSSSAGNSYSTLSRQAKRTKVAKAPTMPMAPIHQMCQIIAKPVITAKKAVTNPVRLLRGISIAAYFGSGDICACAIARCLIPQ